MTQPSFLDDPRRFRIALWVLSVGCLVWWAFISWTQFRSVHVFLADVGSFHSLVSGPLHGVWLQTPVAWKVDGANYFGIHFQPILVLLTALYAVFADHALVLMWAMTAALALAAIPLGEYAARVLQSRTLALAVAIAWLGNHFVLSTHLANHPESLAMPAFFGLFLAVEARSRAWAIACALLVLCVKEDYALYLLLFAGALALDRETRRWALALAIGAIAWGVLSVVVMKLCGAAAMAAAGATPASRFASMGDTPVRVATHLVTHPIETARRLLAPSVVVLYASVAFLPLFDRRGFWLPAVSIAPMLLADDPFLRDLLYYYAYPALPFLFWSATRGLAVVREKLPHPATTPVIAAGLLLAAILGVLAPTRTDGLRHRPYEITYRDLRLPVVLESLPANAPTMAQFEVFPQVPMRPVLLPMRLRYLDQVDYVVIDYRRIPSDMPGGSEEIRQFGEEVRARGFKEHAYDSGYAILRAPWAEETAPSTR